MCVYLGSRSISTVSYMIAVGLCMYYTATCSLWVRREARPKAQKLLVDLLGLSPKSASHRTCPKGPNYINMEGWALVCRAFVGIWILRVVVQVPCGSFQKCGPQYRSQVVHGCGYKDTPKKGHPKKTETAMWEIPMRRLIRRRRTPSRQEECLSCLGD